MKGRTNSNGVLLSKTAFIKVLAKVGSTITFSKGGYTVKVLDPSFGFTDSDNSEIAYYYYYINVYNYGVWTISTEINGNTDSTTVEITDDRIYNVDLSGILYIYRNGRLNEEITDGMATTNRKYSSSSATAKNPTITWYDSYFTWYMNNGGGTFQSRSTIDVTDYNTLDAYAEYTATSDGTIGFGISTASTGYWGSAWTAYFSLNRDETILDHYTVDISNVTGSYYLVIAGTRASVVNSANFYQISFRK